MTKLIILFGTTITFRTSFSSIAYFRQFSVSPAKVILIQGPAAMLTVAPGREACPESSAT